VPFGRVRQSWIACDPGETPDLLMPRKSGFKFADYLASHNACGSPSITRPNGAFLLSASSQVSK
jgi:hypothetical protein